MFWHRSRLFSPMHGALVLLVVGVLACVTGNPHLKPAIDAGAARQAQEAHRLFRLAVEQTPDRPNPFIYYIRWAGEHYQEQAEHLGQVVGQLHEATELSRLSAQLQAGVAEMDELAAYLTARCRYEESSWATAFSYFEKRRGELTTLLRHYITETEERRAKFAQLSQQAVRAGILAKDKGEREEAANYFSQALAYDRGNDLARSMRERLAALESAERAVAERRLDQAISQFEALMTAYPGDEFILRVSRQTLTNLRIVRGQAMDLLLQAERAASRRHLDLALAHLDRALSSHSELAPLVDARRKALQDSMTAQKFAAQGRYDEALNTLNSARDSWNYQGLDAWIKDVELKGRQAYAIRLVEQGALLLSQGDVPGGLALLGQAQEIAVNKAPVSRAIVKARRDAQAHYLRMGRHAASKRDDLTAWRYFGFCHEVTPNSACQREQALARKALVSYLTDLSEQQVTGTPEQTFIALKALQQLGALPQDDIPRLDAAREAVLLVIERERPRLDASTLSPDPAQQALRHDALVAALSANGLEVSGCADDAPDTFPLCFLLSIRPAPEVAAIRPPEPPAVPGQPERVPPPTLNSLISLDLPDGNNLFAQRLDGPPEGELELAPVMDRLVKALAAHLEQRPKPAAFVRTVRRYLTGLEAQEPDWLRLVELRREKSSTN